MKKKRWMILGALSVYILYANVGFAIAQSPPLTIGASALSDGEVGLACSASLGINGGSPPYTLSVMRGSLPSGLSLSSEGLIAGLLLRLGPRVLLSR